VARLQDDEHCSRHATFRRQVGTEPESVAVGPFVVAVPHLLASCGITPTTDDR
jgi:hypothetical protein